MSFSFRTVVRASTSILAGAALVSASALLAQAAGTRSPIPTPVSDITDPASLASPVNPDAAPVPLSDLSATRAAGSAVWTPDGKNIVMTSNFSGRLNIWKLTEGEMMPLQLTQSEEAQTGLAMSADGHHVYFTADKGGREVYDLFRVPVNGGAVENLTRSDDMSESNPIMSKDGKSALLTLRRADGSIRDVGVMDLATAKIRNLTNERDTTLQWRPIAYLPGGTSILAGRNTADYAASTAFVIDLATGKQTQIIPSKPADFVDPAAVSPDGNLIAFTTTMTTGRNHAGVYNLTTKKITYLPPTVWPQSAVTFTPDGRELIVQDSVDGRVGLSFVNLQTMATRPVNAPPGFIALDGLQQGAFNPVTGQLLVNRDAGDSPYQYWLVDPSGAKPARQITRLAIASLRTENLPKNSIVHYRSFDGTPISALVMMPFNLKRDGSNPLIVMPHGGPPDQSQDYFNKFATALASRGFIVMQPNYRGSTGYGDAFMNSNDNDFGNGDVKDIVEGVAFMKRTGFVDPAKVGIFGGSYGGYLTLMGLGKHPDVFHAGVNMFGIINWYTMYENKEGGLHEYLKAKLGDPAQNKALYDAASPMTYAKNIRAPLLILQGENDARVPKNQAEDAAKLIKANGSIVETVFYADEGHGFLKRENAADSLQRMVDWFETHLKAPKAVAK